MPSSLSLAVRAGCVAGMGLRTACWIGTDPETLR